MEQYCKSSNVLDNLGVHFKNTANTKSPINGRKAKKTFIIRFCAIILMIVLTNCGWYRESISLSFPNGNGQQMLILIYPWKEIGVIDSAKIGIGYSKTFFIPLDKNGLSKVIFDRSLNIVVSNNGVLLNEFVTEEGIRYDAGVDLGLKKKGAIATFTSGNAIFVFVSLDDWKSFTQVSHPLK